MASQPPEFFVLASSAQLEFSLASLTTASTLQGEGVSSAQALLRPVLELLGSDKISLSSKRDEIKRRGLRQQVLNCSVESCDQVLSDNLRRLGESLLHDPSFVAVGEELLQAVVKAKLENWQEAQHALEVHWGTGGSLGEQLGKTLRSFSQTKTLAPMVVAMAGAGLVGRGVKLLGTHLFRGTSLMIKGGEWAVHAVASASGLLAEAAVFPGMHAGGALLVNQPVHLENYLGQAWDGLALMGSLRFANAAARMTRQGIHGIKLASSTSGMVLPVATRFRSLSSLTQFILPAAYELGTLTLLNQHNHSQQTLAANFAGAIGLALEFRLAGAALQGLAPGLSAANRSLELKSMEALKTSGLRLASSFSQKVNNLLGGPGAGSGLRGGPREALAGVGRAVPELGQRSEIASLQRELLIARLQSQGSGATGGPEGPRRLKVSQAVREGMEISETFYLDLQREMEGRGEIPADQVLKRSPLTHDHWNAFKQVVDGAAEGRLDRHEAACRLITILYWDFIEKVKTFAHDSSVGTLRESLLVTEANHNNESLLEMVESIKQEGMSVLGKDIKKYSSLKAIVSFLRELQTYTNLLLTGGEWKLQPLSLVKSKLGAGATFHLKFPNPVDYLEFFFNSGLSVNFTFPRVLPKFWVVHKVNIDPKEKRDLSQGRYMLLSPFAQSPIHYGLSKAYLLSKHEATNAHPMTVLYHDLTHVMVLSKFPTSIAFTQQWMAATYEELSEDLDSPALSNIFQALVYDFGGANIDFLTVHSFRDSYFSLFLRSMVSAEQFGLRDAYTQRFRARLQLALTESKTDSKRRSFERMIECFESAEQRLTQMRGQQDIFYSTFLRELS